MNELELLRQGGVVGGGGAGFPLWKKLASPAETLLINGAECEPVLQSDQYLMLKYPDLLVRAAGRLARIVGAREAVICLKDHYVPQIRALQDALCAARGARSAGELGEDAPIKGAPNEGARIDRAPIKGNLNEDAQIKGALNVGAPINGAPNKGVLNDRAPIKGNLNEDAQIKGALNVGAPINGAPIKGVLTKVALNEGAPIRCALNERAPIEGILSEDAPIDGAPVQDAPAEDAPVNGYAQVDAESGGICPPVRLHLLPTVYPIGDEQALVHSATGKTVPPGALPGSVGCCVVSVSTALNGLRALQGKPVLSRFVTIAGEVKHPGVYCAPIGTPVSLLLQAAGGVKISEYRLQLGGPMMGRIAGENEEIVLTKTMGGVLVLPKEHRLVKHADLPLDQVRNRAKSVCIQCRTCTDLCPRHLLGHPIYPHLTMRAFALGNRLEPSAALCMECGICELYACPMGLNPRRVQQLHKSMLREQGQKSTFALKDAPALAEHRAVPSGRVAARAGVSGYLFDTPHQAIQVQTPLVCIPLKQHIGAPSQATVAVGDWVQRGDTIGRMAEGALGCDVHASICGRVERVEQGMVVIRAGE